MKVIYRDYIGCVEAVVDELVIDFVDGYVLFTSGEKEYKIPVGHIVSIIKID